MARTPVSKKLRFEVLKRDNFTCQYCGATSPNAILEVDHINPVSNGGTNDISNLVTSCRDCNKGKFKRELSQAFIEKLNSNRPSEWELMEEQIQNELNIKQKKLDLEKKILHKCIDAINEYLLNAIERTLNKNEKEDVISLIKSYGFKDVFNACESIYHKNSLIYSFSYQEIYIAIKGLKKGA